MVKNEFEVIPVKIIFAKAKRCDLVFIIKFYIWAIFTLLTTIVVGRSWVVMYEFANSRISAFTSLTSIMHVGVCEPVDHENGGI